MLIFCFLVVFLIYTLFKEAAVKFEVTENNIIVSPLSVIGIFLFSLFVGLRYNIGVDMDFEGYCDMVAIGDNHFYYDHLEFFPQKLIDVVQFLRLPVYFWFIAMGGALITLTMWAAKSLNGTYYPYVFSGLILFYLAFDMNGVRQGVALSAFLCAVTYIPSKQWKIYLLFMALAFGFHRTSLIFLPIYLLTYIDWDSNVLKKYIIISIITLLGLTSIFTILSQFTFVIELMGMEDKLANRLEGTGGEEIALGSGLGVALRYVRWFTLSICTYKLIKITDNDTLKILFSIFIIGFVMDPFTMVEIGMGRMALYFQIVEVLLYPYIIRYFFLLTNNSYPLVIPTFIFIVFVHIYQLGMYFSKWNFVSL